ncbi:hypothetical protein [Gordonia sp. 'Campus']|uniref:hypothetical protein n=1 Tax=Gordonia sp. 'Campus' TaxID=2915824 RepID=UPI001EE40266|nr:hypothetical protein [Gordonia sp. 'Campus']
MLAALLITAGLAACGGAPAPDGPVREPAADAHTPPGFDTTFRWTATASLDPTSAEGTFVRAFVESFELANAGRSADWGYPGFVDAAPSNIGQMVVAYPTDVSIHREAGTAFYRGLRRVDGAGSVRIVLCRHGFRSVLQNDRWTVGFDTPRPVEIDVRRVGTEPARAPSGSERLPGADVFGGWYASRYDFAALYPTPTPDQNACAATTPVDMPHWLPTSADDPWPTMPPVPGWTAYPGAG